MALSVASHRSTTLQALTVLSVFAVLVADVGGRHHVCPPFSCGGFSNISYPFRRQGDPHGCGFKSYELVCTNTSATIRIGSGTYTVLSINYTGSYFWIVDANLGMQNSCPLPRWDYYGAYDHYGGVFINAESPRTIELGTYSSGWAIFMNCSQEIKFDGLWWPVKCLSTTESLIYLLIPSPDSYFVQAWNFMPSCGYLARTPLGGPGAWGLDKNSSYPDVVEHMRKGFALNFLLRLAMTPKRASASESCREHYLGASERTSGIIVFWTFLLLTSISGHALLTNLHQLIV
ncbi:unnamed protein product [Urochloa humidicola]